MGFGEHNGNGFSHLFSFINSGVTLSSDALLFWILSIVTLGSGLAVLLFANPIFSALSLAATMVSVAALFVTLGAYFIAGVQLIVYAGAVMVLFVMVLMLFDLKKELVAFTHGMFTGALKILTVGVMGGLIVGAITMGNDLMVAPVAPTEVEASMVGTPAASPDASTKKLGEALFVKHVFGFEALGVLLLVIAVGTVALSRSRGGTHAR